MRSNSLAKFGITFLIVGLMGLPAFAVSPKSSGKKTSSHRSSRIGHHLRKSSWKRHGQQKISTDRAREIQEALIREHYLDGQPTGVWDNRTQAAMRKFQADQGWQNKVVPDSRALIKLGLGPSHENDLNPDLMGDGGFTPIAAPLLDSTTVNDIPRQ
jgi:peptidoglycan hydrolase-like protein with peptidoglycan-binding domain